MPIPSYFDLQGNILPDNNPVGIRTAGVSISGGGILSLSDIEAFKNITACQHIIIQHVGGTNPIRIGAPGDSLFSTNFDTFNLGELDGQQGWAWDNTSNEKAFKIAADNTLGGGKCLHLDSLAGIPAGTTSVYTGPFLGGAKPANTAFKVKFSSLFNNWVGSLDIQVGMFSTASGNRTTLAQAGFGYPPSYVYIDSNGAFTIPANVLAQVRQDVIFYLDGAGNCTVVINGVPFFGAGYNNLNTFDKFYIQAQNLNKNGYVSEGQWRLNNFSVEQIPVIGEGFPLPDGGKQEFYANEASSLDPSNIALFSDGVGGTSDVFIFIRGT